jgi:hypothetical protein
LVNETSNEECSVIFNCEIIVRFKSKPAVENNFTSKKYIALIDENNSKSNYYYHESTLFTEKLIKVCIRKFVVANV